MSENDQDKSVFDMDIGEMRRAWNRTFFSKRIAVAGPVVLAVGAPIIALGAPAIIGAIVGMYAGMEVSLRVFKRKRKEKSNYHNIVCVILKSCRLNSIFREFSIDSWHEN